MTRIIYYLYDTDHEDDDDEQFGELVVERFTVMGVVNLVALAFILLLSIGLLFWSPNYSLYCGGLFGFARFISFTFFARLILFAGATALFANPATTLDGVSIGLYAAILYCTVLHDFIFRRHCKAWENLQEQASFVKGVAKKAASAAGNYAYDTCAKIGSQISSISSLLAEKGSQMTETMRKQLEEYKDQLASQLNALQEALKTKNEALIQATVNATEVLYSAGDQFLGGLMDWFDRLINAAAVQPKSFDVSGVGLMFEQADQAALAKGRAAERVELGQDRVNDPTVIERLQMAVGLKDKEKVLDERLAKVLQVPVEQLPGAGQIDSVFHLLAAGVDPEFVIPQWEAPQLELDDFLKVKIDPAEYATDIAAVPRLSPKADEAAVTRLSPQAGEVGFYQRYGGSNAPKAKTRSRSSSLISQLD
jgi:hypothetical protein